MMAAEKALMVVERAGEEVMVGGQKGEAKVKERTVSTFKLTTIGIQILVGLGR